jgi:hypothetical protein
MKMVALSKGETDLAQFLDKEIGWETENFPCSAGNFLDSEIQGFIHKLEKRSADVESNFQETT